MSEENDIFQKTQWTMVLNASDKDQNTAFQALSSLCKAYWYPLYVFARCRGKEAFEAEDLVQGFFSRLLNNPQCLKGVSPEKGKFRAYLLSSFKSYLIEEYRYELAQKRGGDQIHLDLDAMSAEERYQTEAQMAGNDNRTYDRVWANEIVNQVTKRLMEEYKNRGQLKHFQIMADKLLLADCNYDEFASEMGVSYNTARITFYRFRKRWRDLLYQEVAQTICSDNREDIESEIYYLISCLAKQ